MNETEKDEVTKTMNKLSDTDQTQIAGGNSEKESVNADKQNSRNFMIKVAYGMEPPKKLDTEILLPPESLKGE